MNTQTIIWIIAIIAAVLLIVVLCSRKGRKAAAGFIEGTADALGDIASGFGDACD